MPKNTSNKTGTGSGAARQRGSISTAQKKTSAGNSSKKGKETERKAAGISVMPKRRISARDILDERLDREKTTTTTDNPVPSETRLRR